MGELLQSYWFPLYSFARHRGLSPQDSEDRIQGFFASLLQKDGLQSITPEKGKLRAFLLASLKNYLNGEWRKQQAQKRGGGQTQIPIDQQWAEEQISLEVDNSPVSPDEQFDRRWAHAILDQVFASLRQRYVQDGREEVFDTLQDSIWGEALRGSNEIHAKSLGMSNVAVRAAASRLRRRFRETLEAEILDTVSDEALAKEEVAHLRQILTQK